MILAVQAPDLTTMKTMIIPHDQLTSSPIFAIYLSAGNVLDIMVYPQLYMRLLVCNDTAILMSSVSIFRRQVRGWY